MSATFDEATLKDLVIHSPHEHDRSVYLHLLLLKVESRARRESREQVAEAMRTLHEDAAYKYGERERGEMSFEEKVADDVCVKLQGEL